MTNQRVSGYFIPDEKLHMFQHESVVAIMAAMTNPDCSCTLEVVVNGRKYWLNGEFLRFVERQLTPAMRDSSPRRIVGVKTALRELADKWITQARNNGDGHKEECALELLETIGMKS